MAAAAATNIHRALELADAAVHSATFKIERAVPHQGMDCEVVAAHAHGDRAGREGDRVCIGRHAGGGFLAGPYDGHGGRDWKAGM